MLVVWVFYFYFIVLSFVVGLWLLITQLVTWLVLIRLLSVVWINVRVIAMNCLRQLIDSPVGEVRSAFLLEAQVLIEVVNVVAISNDIVLNVLLLGLLLSSQVL